MIPRQSGTNFILSEPHLQRNFLLNILLACKDDIDLAFFVILMNQIYKVQYTLLSLATVYKYFTYFVHF